MNVQPFLTKAKAVLVNKFRSACHFVNDHKAIAIAAAVVGLTAFFPHPAAAGPINWTTFVTFFTDAQTAIMIGAAVLCVFCIVGGLVAIGVNGGINGLVIGLFGGAFLSVCVMAAPAIVSWAKGLATGGA